MHPAGAPSSCRRRDRRPPVARAEPLGAALVWQAATPDLLRDPHDGAFVPPACRAAARAHELRVGRGRRDGSEHGGHAGPVEVDDIGRRRDGRAGVAVQRGGLLAPDLTDLTPAPLACRSTRGAVRGRHVQIARPTSDIGGDGSGCEPSTAVGRRAAIPGEPEPSVARGRPGRLVRRALALGIEHADGRLGEEDGPAVDVAHHDRLATARAPATALRRRVEEHGAGRTRDGERPVRTCGLGKVAGLRGAGRVFPGGRDRGRVHRRRIGASAVAAGSEEASYEVHDPSASGQHQSTVRRRSPTRGVGGRGRGRATTRSVGDGRRGRSRHRPPSDGRHRGRRGGRGGP